MIGYVTLGTNDMERATRFYDALLAEIGGKRFLDFGTFISWAVDPRKPSFAIAKPYDGKAATVGNGVMVALHMSSSEAVDKFYKKALELGGTDEGAPGLRADNFYAAYFRDLDGNKLNAFCLVGQ